jgi:hypothetical protein
MTGWDCTISARGNREREVVLGARQGPVEHVVHCLHSSCQQRKWKGGRGKIKKQGSKTQCAPFEGQGRLFGRLVAFGHVGPNHHGMCCVAVVTCGVERTANSIDKNFMTYCWECGSVSAWVTAGVEVRGKF